jgi:hypothetical protein
MLRLPLRVEFQAHYAASMTCNANRLAFVSADRESDGGRADNARMTAFNEPFAPLRELTARHFCARYISGAQVRAASDRRRFGPNMSGPVVGRTSDLRSAHALR